MCILKQIVGDRIYTVFWHECTMITSTTIPNNGGKLDLHELCILVLCVYVFVDLDG